MSTEPPQDNPLKSMTDKIRSWWNRTPQAQRAYEKLSADLDNVVSKVESAVNENETLRDLRTKVGAAIDPPTTRPDAAVDAPATPQTAEAGASPPPPVAAEMSPPPLPTSSLPTPSTVDSGGDTINPTPDIEARRLPGGDA